ncbi:MAG: DUF4020 domain-containing protein [Candidatus Nanopelagicales bacterium]|nr:DUF4020 domain-containing protein [Candidatus Nanopelagicales bacterium]
MHITGKVELPDAVLDAHAEGRLVLFVGAGVSMSAPANLPSFEGLARGIANRRNTSEEVMKQFETRPDALLGHLQKQGAPVYDLVAEVLANPDSRPNINHRALVEIASACPTFRIVTTNFDDHLSSALGDAGVSNVGKYVGPALPLGGSFSGLVQLHGSAVGRIEEMVLTDADLGVSYLTEAWAARFLFPMFRDLVVLFVGYSHRDTVMDYLAVGLRGAQGRYVLTDEPDDDLWGRLDIAPIAYPNEDGLHSELTQALEAWAQIVSEGGLARRERVKRIVSGPPTAELSELEYLARAIHSVDGSEAFREFASQADWIEWLATSDAFKHNWTDTSEDGTWIQLAYWFADAALSSPAAERIALNELKRRPGLSPHLWSALASAVARQAKDGPNETYERWVAVLLSQPVDMFAVGAFLGILLHSAKWKDHRRALLLLWRTALQPRLELENRFGLGGFEEGAWPSSTISWPTRDFAVEDVWASELQPNLSEAAPYLLEIGEHALKGACELYSAYQQGDSAFDPINFRRSAIEPHAQDEHREIADAIIDSVRDSLASIAASDKQAAAAIVERWLSTDLLLFKRLALWGMLLTHEDVDERIRLVLSEGLLYEYGLKHEVFLLIRESLEQASVETRRLLLAAALDTPIDPKYADRKRYDLLNWLLAADASWAEAASALAPLQAAHAIWEIGEHPDLDSFTSGGWVEPRPPFDEAKFDAELADDPVAAIRKLLAVEYGDHWSDKPSWDDGVAQVAGAVGRSPGKGIGIWNLALGQCSSPQLEQLASAVLSGWRESDLELPWESLLAAISSWSDFNGIERALSSLLLRGVRGSEDLIPAAARNSAFALSCRLWDSRIDSFSGSSAVDAMFEALNSWPGVLTQFWIHLTSQIRQDDPQNALVLECGERFSMIAGSMDERLAGPRAAMGAELAFLFHAYEDLIADHVFRSMESAEGGGRHFWEGHLYHPRVNLRMIDRGYADATLSFSACVNQLDKRLQRQFFGLVVSIADAPNSNGTGSTEYLSSILSKIQPDQVPFAMSAVEHYLDYEDGAKSDQIWTRWLCQFTRDLSRGLPITVSDPDWCIAASWLAALDQEFEHAVDLVVRRDFKLGNHSSVLRRLESSTHPERHPLGTIELMAHLLSHVENPQWLGYEVGPIVRRLRKQQGPDAVQILVDRAIQGGIPAAAGWLDSSTDPIDEFAG